MAEKKKSPRKKRKPPPGDAARIIDAALDLAANVGWRSLSMTDLSEVTGLSLPRIHAIYPCKAMILNGMIQRTDEQVLAGGDADGDSVRDRLFDLLMRRFDALNPTKKAIRAIAKDTWCDPAALLLTGPRMLSSMYWMLEEANVNTNGLLGAARCKGLLLIYMNAFRVWLNDDTEDMAATMAELDRGLRRADRLESFRRGR